MFYEEGDTVIIQSEPVRAWCQSCRSQVTLINVRPWPKGVLVVGECPDCQASLASRKPVGWSASADPTLVGAKEASSQG